MTDDRSLERAARSWLEAGPTEAPDHAVDAALLRIQATHQERDLAIPRRVRSMSTTARLAVAAIAIAVVAVGGALLFKPGGTQGVGGSTPSPSVSSPSPSSAAVVPPASAVPSLSPLDYASLHGQILMEHLGNAPDRSEMPTAEYHPERRRLFWMDPATMTGATAREFLPGQPPTGKLNADVSRDGRQVVFMDTADPADVWLANADGTGLRDLSGDCTCDELDPAFDPTGTQVVFVHVEGAHRNSVFGANLQLDWDGRSGVTSWLGIRDLATNQVSKLAATSKSGHDGLPYQPSWSPDGTEIVFDRVSWGAGGAPTSRLEIVNVLTGQVRTLATSDPQSGLSARTPGDAAWSPDGSTIVFSDQPISTTGSIADLPPGLGVLTVRADGTGLKRLADGSGASFMPDGRIVYQNNYFWVMNADGTESRPVNVHGDDLTELEVGFAYIPHWVGAP